MFKGYTRMVSACRARCFRAGTFASLFTGVVFILDSQSALAQCQMQRITADDTFNGWPVGFGSSMDVDGALAAVGATVGVFGPVNINSGYVYVYRLENGRWVEEDRLAPSDGTSQDNFGESVSVSGDRVAAGAAGAVYVFRRTETGWIEEQKLVPWDGVTDNFFGWSDVAISEDLIVIGAESDRDAGVEAGAAYVFRHNAIAWEPEQKLVASDAHGYEGFGQALDSDNGRIVIGSRAHRHGNGGTGWVYVYRYIDGSWKEESHFTGKDTEYLDAFGLRVSLSGDSILVGAPYQEDFLANAGAVYAFHLEENAWLEERKLVPPGLQVNDLVGGGALALNDTLAIFGHPNAVAPSWGNTYVYERSGASWSLRCTLANGGGAPVAVSTDHAFVGAGSDVVVYALARPCRSLPDFAAFQRCFPGGSVMLNEACASLDGDGDDDIDLEDFSTFREHLTGPGDACPEQ
jgi:hypothetical protein